MIKRSILLCVCAVALSACVAGPRFEYGAYEQTLYAYYKKPEMADKFETALEKAIEKGEREDRLAPGLYAELGYLKLDQGDPVAAIEFFRREVEAFPESEVFISGVVKRLEGQATEVDVQEHLTDSEQAPDGIMSQGQTQEEVGV